MPPPSTLSAHDIGISALNEANRTVLARTFQGTKLQFGSVNKASTVKSLMKSAKGVRSSGSKLAGGTTKAASSGGGGGGGAVKGALGLPGVEKAVKEFIVQCADLDGIHEVIEALTAQVLQDILAEIVPVLGILVSGGKLAKAAKAVADDGHNLYKFNDYASGIRSGDPLAAAQAVKTLIQRDLAKHSVQLAQQSLATGAKIAGLLADMGTATTVGIGLANALASLGLELYALGVAIKEMRAGNRRLGTPETLDLTVFDECPILGCYLLTCADTSAVANFFVNDIGQPGWMDKVETLKKTQMDPLLKIARKSIGGAKIQLTGLSQNKGTFPDPGFYASIRRKANQLLSSKK
ncbi:hypothetical protein [Aquabacterium sp.]|uniref:hypothetical protein n=1 Tax=Aquabacterium sp. TaxID=1872578 RepID=UPI003D6D08CE